MESKAPGPGADMGGSLVVLDVQVSKQRWAGSLIRSQDQGEAAFF